jgi:transcriptional regulator MraZ
MFRGLTAINLDAKGRMAMPVKYRTLLSNQANNHVILTIDTEDACLLLYPLPEWEKIEQKLEALPSFHSTTRRIQRLLLGHATELELDKNGRLLIPSLLREYATIEKAVMLVGQGKKFELWSDSAWQSGRKAWLAQKNPKDITGLPDELKEISL